MGTIIPSSIPDEGELVFGCQLSGCPNKFRRKHGHSFIICYATPGLDVLEDGSYQQYESHICDEDGNGQHWACCHEHAVQLAHACIDEHVTHGKNSHKWSKTPTIIQ